MSGYSKLKSRSKKSLNYWVESAKQDFMISVHSAMRRDEISKAKLAELVSCSPAYITKVLKGDANFTIETMVKIARALNSKLCIQLAEPHQSIRWFGVVESRKQAEHRPATINRHWIQGNERDLRETALRAS
jgi:transcriptional regulator with XRE-family HTH domain